ncbi:hypothetical protein SAMN05443144_1076 [Fodinibius roseus]|uniref:Outer membrane protein beta-barrel domain-containing protein n=1 Tax=Fodinibius roseus TaxID=1194090 RepID=A0A1M5AAF9_9BACT|nr:hypothetical protein [Fodinibius roseus]SHF27310.1 hypothetical protein SAMN05443144_1076 [Fodinibius roseus]
MMNHSLKRRYSQFRSQAAVIVFAVCFLLSSAGVVRAQMFSMDEEAPPQFRQPVNELYIGYEPTTVTYEGSQNTNEAGQFAYDAPVLRVGYSSRMLNLYLGTGGNITGSDDVAYFDVGGNINVGFPLYFTEKFSLLLPVRISSRLTNITNERTGISLDRFRFGSVTAGAGLQANARPVRNMRIRVGAIPSYGFTFASGGLFGGSLGSVALKGRLYFDRLFGNVGLSAGYKYDLRNYNVEEEKYDYRMQGHSIQLGITF